MKKGLLHQVNTVRCLSCLFLTILFFTISASNAYAVGEEVTGEIKKIAEVATTVSILLAGIFAHIGAIRAAWKFFNGESDSVRSLVNWVGGCLVVWAAFVVVETMFKA